MESDLLWNDMYNTPEDNYFAYRKLWLNMCANISQIGKPVVLCGCAVPEQFEFHQERDLFSNIYYLALVGDEPTINARMRDGRKIIDENWISSSISFNNWLKENHDKTNPEITLIDTTNKTISDYADIVNDWIINNINTTK